MPYLSNPFVDVYPLQSFSGSKLMTPYIKDISYDRTLLHFKFSNFTNTCCCCLSIHYWVSVCNCGQLQLSPHLCVCDFEFSIIKRSWEQKKDPTRCLDVPHYYTWVLNVCLADLKVSHIHAGHGCGFILRAQVATSYKYLGAPYLDCVVRNFTYKVINFKYNGAEVDPCICMLSIWFPWDDNFFT